MTPSDWLRLGIFILGINAIIAGAFIIKANLSEDE